MLAGLALAHAALYVATERQLYANEPKTKETTQSRPLRFGVLVLTSIVVNDRGSYEDAIWCVVLAAETLRAELDRRASEEQG